MKKPLTIAACVTLVLFCALTIWSATIHGIYEIPNLDDFIAGAAEFQRAIETTRRDARAYSQEKLFLGKSATGKGELKPGDRSWK